MLFYALLETSALEGADISYSRSLFLFFLRGEKINIKIFNIVVTIYQYISYICIKFKN